MGDCRMCKFKPEHYAKAKEILERVAGENINKEYTYKEFVIQMGKDFPVHLDIPSEMVKLLGMFLGQVSRRSKNEYGLMLSTVVINQEFRLPGISYFGLAETLYHIDLRNDEDCINFWYDQREKLWKKFTKTRIPDFLK